jgi:hypothetical protein
VEPKEKHSEVDIVAAEWEFLSQEVSGKIMLV